MGKLVDFKRQQEAQRPIAKDNKLIIRIKDGRVTYNCENPIPFDDLVSVTLTVLLAAMNNIVDGVEDENLKLAAKGTLYDMVNVAASHTLEMFAPEFELRPNLTSQAILEAENKIIMEGRFAGLEPGT